MTADFSFADGRTGRMTCSLFSHTLLRLGARVVGDAGDLTVTNFTAPQYHHRLAVHVGSARRIERLKSDVTYVHQLRAFADAVLRDGPVLTPPADSVANMRVIDAVYEAAGLPARGT
jgi:predicted dehydrogenase